MASSNTSPKPTRTSTRTRVKKEKPAEEIGEEQAPVGRAATLAHDYRYICPEEGCTESNNYLAQLRGHHKSAHPDQKWDPESNHRFPWLDWLAGKTKSPATVPAIRDWGHLLEKSTASDTATETTSSAAPPKKTAAKAAPTATKPSDQSVFKKPERPASAIGPAAKRVKKPSEVALGKRKDRDELAAQEPATEDTDLSASARKEAMGEAKELSEKAKGKRRAREDLPSSKMVDNAVDSLRDPGPDDPEHPSYPSEKRQRMLDIATFCRNYVVNIHDDEMEKLENKIARMQEELNAVLARERGFIQEIEMLRSGRAQGGFQW